MENLWADTWVILKNTHAKLLPPIALAEENGRKNPGRLSIFLYSPLRPLQGTNRVFIQCGQNNIRNEPNSQI